MPSGLETRLNTRTCESSYFEPEGHALSLMGCKVALPPCPNRGSAHTGTTPAERTPVCPPARATGQSQLGPSHIRLLANKKGTCSGRFWHLLSSLAPRGYWPFPTLGRSTRSGCSWRRSHGRGASTHETSPCSLTWDAWLPVSPLLHHTLQPAPRGQGDGGPRGTHHGGKKVGKVSLAHPGV